MITTNLTVVVTIMEVWWDDDTVYDDDDDDDVVPRPPRIFFGVCIIIMYMVSVDVFTCFFVYFCKFRNISWWREQTSVNCETRCQGG
jgi:hypothetical protein